jgi:hypothetical protein
VAVGVLAGLALAAIVGAISLLPATAVRSRFEEGKVLLTRGQNALSRGDAAAAAAAFGRARSAFDAATRQQGVFLLRAEGVVPFLGRTPRAILSLADIGRDLSDAGLAAARGVARLPDGLSSLGLSQGRIPVGTLASLAPSLHEARTSLESAAAKAHRLPDSWLIGPVADARQLVQEKVNRALPLVRASDEMLSALPVLAGSADGPRRYFVAAENSAELRGTGGLIGNYAILTIEDGRLSLGPFRDIQSLPTLSADQSFSPSRDFSDLYGPFGGGGFWLNINMTPDAPTAATAIESLYARVTGEHLDGTIFFDLQGLSDLLRATGKVRVDQLGVTLTAQNVTGFVAGGGYLDGDIRDAFREGPRIVAESVWRRFLADASPEDTLHALVGAAGSGHLILHAADPTVQEAFHQAGVDGALAPASGDLFGVVLSNAAANKVDFYLREDARYEVSLEPEGRASATASIRLFNGAPAGSAPNYPLGPHISGIQPGENRLWTQVYCGGVCWLDGALQDGSPFGLERHRELGLDVFAGFVQEKAQESRELTLHMTKTAAWQGDVGGGMYRLRLRAQPMVNPATVTVAIQAPEGMNVVWSNQPMKIQGGRAEWSGTLDRSQDLVVQFRPPLAQRVWARAWDFLSTPVVKL